ncbi:hypothetical protein GGR51DRAFT_521591 [Nemania sp. FL0031]|nr:hypothetical protein GGR51DRAFT_521591 [Nemania sp. FL0031]
MQQGRRISSPPSAPAAQPQDQSQPEVPSMPLMPLGQHRLDPTVSMAITATGCYNQWSPLDIWLAFGLKQCSDSTQTRMVNAMLDILNDPIPAFSLERHDQPDERSHLRFDVSIWVGMPKAPGNFNIGILNGWNAVATGQVNHAGDPRLCRGYERILANMEEMKTRIKGMEIEIEEKDMMIEELEIQLRNVRNTIKAG